jgi:hypothetical protein
MRISPYYPFPPRPGYNFEQEPITSEHVAVLSPENVANVEKFEHQLYDLSVEDDEFPSATAYKLSQEAHDNPIPTLETAWSLKMHVTTLGVEYFRTDEGRAVLETATGVQLSSNQPEAVVSTLTSLDIKSVDAKVLSTLEAKSVGYEEARLTKAFVDGDYKGISVPNPEFIDIHKNPSTLVDKARGYKQIKSYLGHVKTDLTTDAVPSPLTHAKLLIVDLYTKRLNRMLSEVYVDAYKLLAQHQLSGGKMGDVIAELEELLPAFNNRGNKDSVARTLQRMDRFRYGVSRTTEGKLTWLSPEAGQLAAAPSDTVTETTERGIYRDVDPEALDNAEIDGATTGEWIADVLRHYDLLSVDTEWDSERKGPPTDNKWQAIVDDSFKSLSVVDKQRVVKIPSKTRPVRLALELINHEVTHVMQHENKRAIGSLAILDKIGVDDATDQTESGGVWQEDVANGILTGTITNHVSGTGYMKNIEIKGRGGSFGECVEAYYKYVRADQPLLKPEVAALQAVNRARRVFRSGGFEFATDNSYITNTQPLSYLEQALIYSSLDPAQRKLLFVGGVTVANFLRLAEAGLVDTDRVKVPTEMPIEILYPKVVEYLAATKAD